MKLRFVQQTGTDPEWTISPGEWLTLSTPEGYPLLRIDFKQNDLLEIRQLALFRTKAELEQDLKTLRILENL